MLESPYTPSRRAATWTRRRVAGLGSAAALLAAVPWVEALAQGSEAPQKNGLLRILCSGPAGSVPDTVARRVGDALAGRFAQHVVVDNRPGAAGLIAVNGLTAAPADGHTLLLAQGAIATVYPALYPRLAYDAATDLQPVSMAGEMTLGVAVGPAVPESVTTVAGLGEWMRANPGLANAASPGAGTLPHLLEVMLFEEAGVAWQHIVFAGGPPALVALLGGQVSVLVLPEGLLRQHRVDGRLRMLATSGAARSNFSPEVPTLVEAGHPKLVVREWFAFFAPGRTPPAAVASASLALQQAIARPELISSFAESGMVAVSSSPSALGRRISAERSAWEPMIRNAGIRAE